MLVSAVLQSGSVICIHISPPFWGFYFLLVVKNLSANAGDLRDMGFDPWVMKIPWRRKWQFTPVFLPRKFHGQRSLAGDSPWGCKETEVTSHACIPFPLSFPPPPSHPSRSSQSTTLTPCTREHLPTSYFTHGSIIHFSFPWGSKFTFQISILFVSHCRGGLWITELREAVCFQMLATLEPPVF